jgi:hypothetical protein
MLASKASKQPPVVFLVLLLGLPLMRSGLLSYPVLSGRDITRILLVMLPTQPKQAVMLTVMLVLVIRGCSLFQLPRLMRHGLCWRRVLLSVSGRLFTASEIMGITGVTSDLLIMPAGVSVSSSASSGQSTGSQSSLHVRVRLVILMSIPVGSC